jgi:hypothetical protein
MLQSTYEIKSSSFDNRKEENFLPLDPNYPFFLVHFPGNWEVASEGLGEPTWLPQIQRSVMQPGVNGHRTQKVGENFRSRYDLAHNRIKAQGGIVIPLEIELEDGGRYIREISCKGPKTKKEGVYHIEAWQSPKPKLPNQRQKFYFDHASFNQFRKMLVEEGIVPEPQEEVLKQKKARALYHLQRKTVAFEAKGASQVGKDEMLKAAQAKVEETEKAKKPARKTRKASVKPRSSK